MQSMRRGRDKANKPVEGIVDGPTVLKAAFTSDVGADTDMISTANGGYAWYEVAGIEPARQLPLADVRPRVAAAWRKDETTKKLAAKSEALVKAADGGQALTAIATSEGGLKVLHDGDVKRGGAAALSPNVVAAIFLRSRASGRFRGHAGWRTRAVPGPRFPGSADGCRQSGIQETHRAG